MYMVLHEMALRWHEVVLQGIVSALSLSLLPACFIPSSFLFSPFPLILLPLPSSFPSPSSSLPPLHPSLLLPFPLLPSSSPPFLLRAAIILKIADLASTKYRSELLATAMVGQVGIAIMTDFHTPSIHRLQYESWGMRVWECDHSLQACQRIQSKNRETGIVRWVWSQ